MVCSNNNSWPTPSSSAKIIALAETSAVLLKKVPGLNNTLKPLRVPIHSLFWVSKARALISVEGKPPPVSSAPMALNWLVAGLKAANPVCTGLKNTKPSLLIANLLKANSSLPPDMLLTSKDWNCPLGESLNSALSVKDCNTQRFPFMSKSDPYKRIPALFPPKTGFSRAEFVSLYKIVGTWFSTFKRPLKKEEK